MPHKVWYLTIRPPSVHNINRYQRLVVTHNSVSSKLEQTTTTRQRCKLHSSSSRLPQDHHRWLTMTNVKKILTSAQYRPYTSSSSNESSYSNTFLMWNLLWTTYLIKLMMMLSLCCPKSTASLFFLMTGMFQAKLSGRRGSIGKVTARSVSVVSNY